MFKKLSILTVILCMISLNAYAGSDGDIVLKKNKYKSIAVGKIPNKGLGKTINDRLLRASKF